MASENIKKFLSDIKDTLSPTSLSKIAYGVISAISYMHSIGVIHNDIRLSNVMINGESKPYLCGFEYCVYISLESKSSEIGTPIFTAPEKIQGAGCPYSMPVDVYAFGTFLYQIMNIENEVKLNRKRSCRLSHQQMMQITKGARPERLPTINDSLWSLITKCWAQSPDDRPTAEEIQKKLRYDRSILFKGTDFKEYDKYVKNIDDFVRQNKQESWEYFEKELEKYRAKEIKRNGKSKYKIIGTIGKEIDSRFIVQEVLGRGAFAEVYKVFDQEKNIYYAKKTLLKNDHQTTKDMLKEYDILVSLDYISIENFPLH